MANAIHFQLPEWQRLRIWQMCQLTGFSKSKVWELAKSDPTFPKPSKISSRVTVWNAAEVRAWLDAKVGGRQHA
ncbi:MAG: AlpA family phage regulatory protein [Alphaproteobacteria bacterium]